MVTLHATHILPNEGLLWLRGVVSSSAEFDRVNRFGRLLLTRDLALIPLALSKCIIWLALRFNWLTSNAMYVFDCEVAPLNSLTSILAIRCATEKGMRGWCLVHSCWASLGCRIISSQGKVAGSQILGLLSDLFSNFSVISPLVSWVWISDIGVTGLLEGRKWLIVSFLISMAYLNLMQIRGT